MCHWIECAMATLTAQDIQALIQAAVKGAIEAQSGSSGGGDGGDGKGRSFAGKRLELDGKAFESFRKLKGGEGDWAEWSSDFRVLVETRSELTGRVLEWIKKQGRTEKEKEGVYNWKEIKVQLSTEEWSDVQRDGVLEQMSKVVYRWLRLLSEGEAKAVVRSEEESGDGLKAWGRLHATWNKKTLGRLMRVQQAAMYPKKVKVNEVAVGVMECEKTWAKMRDTIKEEEIWELWKMVAVMKMMPDMLVSKAELLWDDIEVVGKGSYERLKEKLMMWAGTEVETKANGGPVHMEVD